MSDALNSSGSAAVERPNIFCAPTHASERTDGAGLAGGIFASDTEPLAEPPTSAARGRVPHALARAGWIALAGAAALALGASVVIAVSLLRADANRPQPVASPPAA